MSPRPFLFALILAPLLLPACDAKQKTTQDLAALDNELTAANAADPAADPAVAAALAGQIMVDPALTQSANAHAIRPPSRPDAGAVPADPPLRDPVPDADVAVAPKAGACPDCAAGAGTLTLGALAERQRRAQTAGCAAKVAYSAGWATRLPAAVPLYPGARLAEAAGNDAGGCSLRVVSFASGARPDKIIGWYRQHVTAAGFDAEVQAQGTTRVLGGTKGDAAYVIYANPRRGGGSDVDLIVNGG